MKKIIAGLMMAVTLVTGFVAGGAVAKATAPQAEKQQVTITRTVTESEEGLYLEAGQEYIELSDGSWLIHGNGEYIFQPIDMGDWNYEADNAEELEKMVKTYMNMKNNGTF